MSTIVFTKFATTEAYRADPSIADEGMKLIGSLEGVVGNYHGIQIEDPTVGYSLQENYVKVAEDKELFAKILDKLAPTRIGDILQYHATTAGDPFKALVGPIHELSYFTLRNPTPENKAKVEQACADHAKMVDGKMTYGWSVEDPNTVLVVHSWESVEAHNAMKNLPEIVEVLGAFGELLDLHGGPFLHVKLIQV